MWDINCSVCFESRCLYFQNPVCGVPCDYWSLYFFPLLVFIITLGYQWEIPSENMDSVAKLLVQQAQCTLSEGKPTWTQRNSPDDLGRSQASSSPLMHTLSEPYSRNEHCIQTLELPHTLFSLFLACQTIHPSINHLTPSQLPTYPYYPSPVSRPFFHLSPHLTMHWTINPCIHLPTHEPPHRYIHLPTQ